MENSQENLEENLPKNPAKKYRPNVAGIVLSSKYPFECKVLLGHRNDMENVWQFPQGGIDEGEAPEKALLRELKEEIGTDEVEIIAVHPEWLNYDFPENVNIKKKYAFDGQSQKYFLVRLKNGAKIDLNTAEPEFDKFEFMTLKQLFSTVHHFKRPVYVRVIQYFQEKGYL